MNGLVLTPSNFHVLCDKLGATDMDLQNIIHMYGYPPLWSRPNTFESLVHIILEQQVSLASAKATLEKLRQRLSGITPERILTLEDVEMKACYVSRQKAGYIRGLALAIVDTTLSLQSLEQADDDMVRSTLTGLKGMGNWTADIYLMFVLHRSDVFPLGDLAAVNAVRRLKDLPAGIQQEELQRIVETWRPYRTVAAMLLWHYYLSSRKPQA